MDAGDFGARRGEGGVGREGWSSESEDRRRDDDYGGGAGPNEWLLRKLTALSSVTQGGNDADAMLGCDAVLLARLLLESILLILKGGWRMMGEREATALLHEAPAKTLTL
jgi:hypothetical protein